MFKKILAINFFGLVLGLISIQTIYSVEKTTTPVDQFVSNNISAENIYYKENPGDFLYNKLMVKKGWAKGGAVCADAGIFALSAYVGGFLSWMTILVIVSSFKVRMCENMYEILKSIALISGLTIGIISAIKFHKYLISPSIRDAIRDEDVFSILESYDPDLSKSNPNNTKLFIPRELHSVFDVLWNIYKQQGEAALKDEWNKVAELIKNKIILKIANPDFKVVK